jgi:hypothetical protein
MRCPSPHLLNYVCIYEKSNWDFKVHL